jgi:FkbM family methyltransferase
VQGDLVGEIQTPHLSETRSRKSFAIAIQQTRFRGFRLFFENPSATESMLRAIDDFPSFFTPVDSDPVMIDGGANIGISVLEWKTRWPMARVICFEPDPDSFRLLQMNIQRNDVPGVQCIEAALNDFDGQCTLFGERGKGADSRGNSIQPEWGVREGSGATKVRCRRLSPFLVEPVAFLKLDIEGAEECVLREASSALHQVDAIYVEVHETESLSETNSSSRITQLLCSSGFSVESESRFQPHALPAHLDSWRRRVGARQTQLLCWREARPGSG